MEFVITKAKNLKHAMQSIFNQIKNESGNVCLLVPDKLTVTAEKKLFEYLNIESCFNINISTLTRFSQKILSDLAVDYTPISKTGSIVLLKRLLNENVEQLRLFNAPSFSYNYTDVLFRTITQFKASKINSNDMILFNKPKQLEDKIHDLKIILEEYENAKAGLIDSTDRLNLLSRYVHKSEYVKNCKFYLLGFDDFTQQGYSLIEQLIKFSQGVNVAVYLSQELNKSIYTDDVVTHLNNIAYSQELPLEFKEFPYEDDELHKNLTSLVFAHKTNSALNTDKIKLINCKNISEEIEYVARNIREQVISGKNYNDFGVACFELEKYKNLVKNIFAKYEINYYIDSSTSLSSSFYFKFFINYLQLFADNFPTANYIELINSPFINFSQDKKIKLNNYLNEISFCGNISKLKTIEGLEEEIDFLKNLISTFPINKKSSIEEVILLCQRLIETFGIEKQVDEIISKTSSLYDKKILSQVATQFFNLLKEVEKFFPTSKLDDIIDVLISAGREQKVMPIPQSLDCVQILDAGELFTDFNQLYFINCNSSTAPMLTQDIGIILDKDIDNLDFKYKLSPTIAHLNRLSKFKLFNSCLMFNDKLNITMSLYSESEKSPLVSSIQSIFSNSKDIFENSNTNSKKILSKWDLIEFLSTTNDNAFAEMFSIYGVEKRTPITTLNYRVNQNFDFNEISCSALENYFKCPMLYFLTNTLKLKQERMQGIAMVDVGNMLHELAEDFYKNANHNNLDVHKFTETKLLEYMQKDRKLEQFINTPIHFNLIKEGVRFLNHLNYLDKNSMFVPSLFEYAFGKKLNKTIPLTNDVYLKGKIDRVDFYEDYVRIIDYKTGNVDASLDDLYYGKKLQLFLYAKLAEKIFNKKLAGSFYMPVKNSILGDSSIKPYKLNGFYIANTSLAEVWDKRIKTTLKSDLMSLSLNKDGDVKVDPRSTKVLLENDMAKLMEYSLNLTQTAIKEIKSGYIMPSPIKFNEQTNSCTYCPYLAVCRKNSMQINMRNKLKTDLSSFGGNNE